MLKHEFDYFAEHVHGSIQYLHPSISENSENNTKDNYVKIINKIVTQYQQNQANVNKNGPIKVKFDNGNSLSISVKDDVISISFEDKTGNLLQTLSQGVVQKTISIPLEKFISILQLDRLKHPKIYKLTDAQRSTITLSGDLRGMNFSGMNLKGVTFTAADLSGSNFSNVNVAGAKFSHVLFNGADLSNTDFGQANALGNVTLPKAKFGDSPRLSRLFGLNLEKVNFTNTHFLPEDLSAHVDNPLAYKTIDSLDNPVLKITLMEQLVSSADQRSGYINWDALPTDVLFKPAYLESQTVRNFIDSRLIPEAITSGNIALWMESRANFTSLTYLLKKQSEMDNIEFSRFVAEKNEFFIRLIHHCKQYADSNDLARKAEQLYNRYASLEPVSEHDRYGHYVLLPGENLDDVRVVSEDELSNIINSELEESSFVEKFKNIINFIELLRAYPKRILFQTMMPHAKCSIAS